MYHFFIHRVFSIFSTGHHRSQYYIEVNPVSSTSGAMVILTNVSSRIKCASRCLSQEHCLSFVFDKLNKKCYLKRNLDSVDGVDDALPYYTADDVNR